MIHYFEIGFYAGFALAILIVYRIAKNLELVR